MRLVDPDGSNIRVLFNPTEINSFILEVCLKTGEWHRVGLVTHFSVSTGVGVGKIITKVCFSRHISGVKEADHLTDRIHARMVELGVEVSYDG